MKASMKSAVSNVGKILEGIPPQFHSTVLYEDTGDLAQKLTHLLTHYPEYQELRGQLSSHMGQFAWPNLIDRYDEELERLVRQSNMSHSND